MRLLCVANWSEGRDTTLLGAMRERLRSFNVCVHFDGADEDHNRLVTAFSGEADPVFETLVSVAEVAFEGIDMQNHEGVHPRIGALDVCPLILLEGDPQEALGFAERTARFLAERFALPIFLYEKSETGKHAADLPSLRKGQFEGLISRPIIPDFGPRLANPRLGATILGVRDWLIAMNVNLPQGALSEAKAIAGEIRVARNLGDDRFAGVLSLGLPLKRKSRAQVSMNLKQPDRVRPDTIVEWIRDRYEVLETELIGVIRDKDVRGATLLPIQPQQVVRVGS